MPQQHRRVATGSNCQFQAEPNCQPELYHSLSGYLVVCLSVCLSLLPSWPVGQQVAMKLLQFRDKYFLVIFSKQESNGEEEAASLA